MKDFQSQMQFAVRTGRCPICRKRPRALWKDGAGLRVTCGNPKCFTEWLPGKKTHMRDAFANPSLITQEEAAL